MTDENGKLNFKSPWTILVLILSTAFGTGFLLPLTEWGVAKITNNVVHIGVAVEDLQTHQEATKTDVLGLHTKVDSLVGDVSTIKSLVTQDIQDGQINAKASRDRSDAADEWRKNASGQINNLQYGMGDLKISVGDLEHRVSHLEGATTHAMGVIAKIKMI